LVFSFVTLHYFQSRTFM